VPAQIVDAHAHFWRRAALERTAGPVPDDPDVPIEQLLDQMTAAGVDTVLHITRGVMGFDNTWSIAEATRHSERVRVLGRVDPRGDDLAGRLDDLLASPIVVGVRVFGTPPEDRWFVDGTLDPFWAEAETRGLPISVYAPNRADQLAVIAERHPELPIVADHLALSVFPSDPVPERVSGLEALLGLGRFPNVAVKVSGLPEITQEGAPFTNALELFRTVYDTFGPARLMWGSNYPPTSRVCTYAETVDLVRTADFLSDDDRAQILGGTATRVFGL
jgi:predicted TIM-barrel fold metal-dependent hydrolase